MGLGRIAVGKFWERVRKQKLLLAKVTRVCAPYDRLLGNDMLMTSYNEFQKRREWEGERERLATESARRTYLTTRFAFASAFFLVADKLLRVTVFAGQEVWAFLALAFVFCCLAALTRFGVL